MMQKRARCKIGIEKNNEDRSPKGFPNLVVCVKINL